MFRHFDSASVVKGLVGEPPKTAWVIGYALFERIHYLLAAGFDVYGNVGHQLNSRLYMDFLRMEGESNFIDLLPRAARESTRDYWYRGASQNVKDYVYGRKAHFDRETGIAYRTSDPQRELYGLLKAQLAPVLGTRYDLATVQDAVLRRDLQSLSSLRGRSLSWLPEVAFVRVDDPSGPARYFTLLRNTGHSNVSHVFSEGQQILPDEHTLTVVPGSSAATRTPSMRCPARIPPARGGHPAPSSEDDYRAFAEHFALRRSDPAFWTVSDALHDAYARSAPGEAGLFDYGRLENR